MTFQFQCPFCGVGMEACALTPESEVQCPACQQAFVVEAPAQPVRVQAVAVPDRPSPGPAAAPHPAPRPKVKRVIVQRKRNREEERAKFAVISMLVGGPLILGGILWAAVSLREKADEPKPRTEIVDILREAEAKRLAFDKTKAEQERKDNVEWEKKNQKIREQEEAAEAAKIQERRDFLKALLARSLFNGDESLAEEAVKEFEAAEKELLGLYSDGIFDNEPGNPEEYLKKSFFTRLMVNKKLSRWVAGRQPGDFDGLIGPGRRSGPDGKPLDPNSVQAALMSGKYRSTGTGFWVSRDGWMLTNAHVAGTAISVELRGPDGKAVNARVVKTNPDKDLALLKAETSPEVWLRVTAGEAAMGAAVFTIGFPRPVIQGVEPKFTDGKISSLSGMMDNKDHYQCTVPVQPGNSGGPLVANVNGWVVGVVNARLGGPGRALDGPAPENVGYAIKAGVVRTFIESVPEARVILDDKVNALKNAAGENEAIDRARKATVLILVK